MSIKAILFDLDETLIAEDSSNHGALAATCELAARRCAIEPARLAESVRKVAVELWVAAPMVAYFRAIGISSSEGLWGNFAGDDPESRTLSEWIPTYRSNVWSRALAEHGVVDRGLALELISTYVRERGARHVVYPDTEPALRSLDGYRLGLVTNGASAVQREKLLRSRLARYFDAVVVSGEVGAGKPDPRIFEHALNQIRAKPADSIMIGDSLRRDIAGARATGIRAVWINRARRDAPSGIVAPDATIRDLSELRAALV